METIKETLNKVKFILFVTYSLMSILLFIIYMFISIFSPNPNNNILVTLCLIYAGLFTIICLITK